VAERENNGRFAKGNGGGPGRPSRITEEDCAKALHDAIPAGELARAAKVILDIVHTAKRPADRIAAWKALAQFMVPTPEQKLDVTSAGKPIEFIEVGVSEPDGE
jgi:hypothetical protein